MLVGWGPRGAAGAAVAGVAATVVAIPAAAVASAKIVPIRRLMCITNPPMPSVQPVGGGPPGEKDNMGNSLPNTP
ncbi:hypothetical protein Apa02nite_024910 [Actinoplanes palleronii]|uniref:Uncharacterized protein n=1 Tax=Actinoplanes palleronii TaxID=113570 RepID=A0ABQ4B6V7_9ACTN|nr:hypothetical protein Apa02nite_024910 [Actinoplanes palleronii]